MGLGGFESDECRACHFCVVEPRVAVGHLLERSLGDLQRGSRVPGGTEETDLPGCVVRWTPTGTPTQPLH